jgi:cytochrome c oxidase assembly factor CtaG
MMITLHWSANPLALGACAVAALLHLRGLLRLLRAPGHASRVAALAREAGVFYLGLLVVLFALVSPVAYWSDTYVWVHAVQDLLLAVVAPPLIVLGSPWLALRAAWSAQPGRLRLPSGSPSGRGGETPWWLTGPALVAVAFNAAWLAWHLPALYDLGLTSRVAGGAEVVSYLVLGIAFWLVLIGSAPLRPRLTPLQRVTLVFGTVAADTVLGMVLVFGSSLLYTSYGSAAHHVLSVVADQQVAGAVLWMGLLPPFVIVAVALFARWLDDEEAEALTAGLNRLLKPPKYTWPSRPGLK